MIDKEDFVALLELALDLPTGRHGLIAHGEQIEEAHEVLIMLILHVVVAGVGADSLQDGSQARARLDELFRLRVLADDGEQVGA